MNADRSIQIGNMEDKLDNVPKGCITAMLKHWPFLHNILYFPKNTEFLEYTNLI